MPKILAFSSSLATLKFSVHNFFETRVLLKIFETEFSYKLSYFEPLCLPAKMAAETVKRPIVKFMALGGSEQRLVEQQKFSAIFKRICGSFLTVVYTERSLKTRLDKRFSETEKYFRFSPNMVTGTNCSIPSQSVPRARITNK